VGLRQRVRRQATELPSQTRVSSLQLTLTRVSPHVTRPSHVHLTTRRRACTRPRVHECCTVCKQKNSFFQINPAPCFFNGMMTLWRARTAASLQPSTGVKPRARRLARRHPTQISFSTRGAFLHEEGALTRFCHTQGISSSLLITIPEVVSMFDGLEPINKVRHVS
jgi:hypothetical protein